MARRSVFLLLVPVVVGCGGKSSAPPLPSDLFGLTERVEVQGLNFPITPQPSVPVQAVRAFPSLSFTCSNINLT